MTAFEFNQLQQRVAANKARRVENRIESAPSEKCAVESNLHDAILQHCKNQGWIAFHGSMAHSTFRTPGEPDFVLLLPGGKFLMVECKTATGKLTPEQHGIIAWAAKLGHVIHVVRSVDEFLKLTINQ